jgi:hypothetical protein
MEISREQRSTVARCNKVGVVIVSRSVEPIGSKFEMAYRSLHLFCENKHALDLFSITDVKTRYSYSMARKSVARLETMVMRELTQSIRKHVVLFTQASTVCH